MNTMDVKTVCVVIYEYRVYIYINTVYAALYEYHVHGYQRVLVYMYA